MKIAKYKNFSLQLLLLVAFLHLFACVQAQTISGKVVRVIDGDTIEILSGGTRYRIRLNGIDCPEKQQAYGNEATKFVMDLCLQKKVTAKIIGTDRYDRHLAEIILSNGHNLNRELVKYGYAWHYKRYSNDKTLDRLEKSARQQKIGLWANPKAIPPWEFRRKNFH